MQWLEDSIAESDVWRSWSVSHFNESLIKSFWSVLFNFFHFKTFCVNTSNSESFTNANSESFKCVRFFSASKSILKILYRLGILLLHFLTDRCGKCGNSFSFNVWWLINLKMLKTLQKKHYFFFHPSRAMNFLELWRFLL